MKVTKDYNKGIDTSSVKLKKGETRVFRILGIKRDKDYPERMVIPAAVIVPSRDIISVKGEPVDMACIKTMGAKNTPIFHELWFLKESAGTITCRGDSLADQQKFEYLMLCNYRSNNPDRDISKRALFELIDLKANAKSRRASRTALLRAMDYAAQMSDEEVETFVAASGWNEPDIEIARDKIEQMAEASPIDFIKKASNRQNNIKADIKKALDKNIITWDKSASKFSWSSNNELIVTVPRSSSGTHLDGMLNFILNKNNGEAVYQEIKIMLSGKDPFKAPVLKAAKLEEIPNTKDLKTVNPNPKEGIDVKKQSFKKPSNTEK